MEAFLTTGSVSNAKCISILVAYLVLASHLQVYGSAFTLPKNVAVPAILVFGDSIVDPGNNDYIQTISKANFPPYGRDFQGGVATGRYSNGKIPSDLIAEAIGIKQLVPPYLDPSLQISDLLTGVSFASGAAGYDPLSAQAATALSLEDQLNLFKEYISKLKAAVGENATSAIISQSVYFVFAGSNDITNSFLVPIRKVQYTTSGYTSMMVNWASEFIQELYSLGARRIGVTNLPPLGCLPSQRTINGGPLRDCSAEENGNAITYNNKLGPALKSLMQKLPGSRVVYLDIFTPLMNLITNPSQYGFQVADRGCCGSGKIEVICLCSKYDTRTCSDASKFVFWDSFHPTEAAYRYLVNDLIKKCITQFY